VHRATTWALVAIFPSVLSKNPDPDETTFHVRFRATRTLSRTSPNDRLTRVGHEWPRFAPMHAPARTWVLTLKGQLKSSSSRLLAAKCWQFEEATLFAARGGEGCVNFASVR
jgi:hypothetical protein